MVLTTLSSEDKVPQEHPLRRREGIAELALLGLEPLFEQMYSQTGRPSIPPERLLAKHVLMETRHSRVVDVRLTPAVGVTELEIELEMLKGIAARCQRPRPV